MLRARGGPHCAGAAGAAVGLRLQLHELHWRPGSEPVACSSLFGELGSCNSAFGDLTKRSQGVSSWDAGAFCGELELSFRFGLLKGKDQRETRSAILVGSPRNTDHRDTQQDIGPGFLGTDPTLHFFFGGCLVIFLVSWTFAFKEYFREEQKSTRSETSGPLERRARTWNLPEGSWNPRIAFGGFHVSGQEGHPPILWIGKGCGPQVLLSPRWAVEGPSVCRSVGRSQLASSVCNPP